jgi:hypothetical protein
VTSNEIDKVPFKQAVTGGTGAYRNAGGELTVDEAGDGPAHVTFDRRGYASIWTVRPSAQSMASR